MHFYNTACYQKSIIRETSTRRYGHGEFFDAEDDDDDKNDDEVNHDDEGGDRGKGGTALAETNRLVSARLHEASEI